MKEIIDDIIEGKTYICIKYISKAFTVDKQYIAIRDNIIMSNYGIAFTVNGINDFRPHFKLYNNYLYPDE